MSAHSFLQDGIVATLCRQCDMHCAVNVEIREGRIVDIQPFEGHPQNRGRICQKGRAAADLVNHADRLLKPLKRRPDGSFEEIALDRALDEIASAMRRIAEEHGTRAMSVWKGEAVGFLQQEEYARRFIHAFGSPNYFSNDSQCFNGRYFGYKLVQGYLAGFPGFADADCIVHWACNPPQSHPTFMRPIADARERGARLVVIDPRLTEICYHADLHLRPLPGTDGALAWGLARLLIEWNEYDREFVEKHSVGFPAFAGYARAFTPEAVEAETGVPARDVIRCAEMIAECRPRVVNYVGAGLEHQENGVNAIRTVACLGGLLGAVDVKGGTPWPEGMGGRDLTLYEELPLLDLEPIGADIFPVLYDLRQECHTMTAIEHMLGTEGYPLRGLIVTAANPVNTNPNARKVARAFQTLDLLVSRELFMTETARLAHYVLPAASFLERSELHYHPQFQLVTLTTKVLEFPGVQDEYAFWRSLAERLGFAEKWFPWKNEEEVNRYILEPTGITLEELRLHPEGIRYKPIRYRKFETRPLNTPSGKFEFTSSYLRERLGMFEIPEYIPPMFRRRHMPDYPFVLTTGARKLLFTHSRFRNIPRFLTVTPRPEVEIHPGDAERLGIADGERVRLVSEIGSLETFARVVHESEILPGVLQATHGWEGGNINVLTYDHVNDPISGFPLLKAVPVRVEKIED